MPNDTQPRPAEELWPTNLPIKDVVVPDDRVRQDLGDLSELAESIERTGVLQPIGVWWNGSGWELYAGERRLEAAKLAGREHIDVWVADDITTRHQAARGEYDENELRKALTQAEKAAAVAKQHHLDPAASARTIARRAGVSDKTAAKHLARSGSGAEIRTSVKAQVAGMKAAPGVANEEAKVRGRDGKLYPAKTPSKAPTKMPSSVPSKRASRASAEPIELNPPLQPSSAVNWEQHLTNLGALRADVISAGQINNRWAAALDTLEQLIEACR